MHFNKITGDFLKKFLRYFCPILIIVFLLFIYTINNIRILEFNPQLCKAYFDCLPEEFNSVNQNFYGRSMLSKKGNLKLILNETELENWAESFDLYIKDAISNGIVISNNFTKISFETYKETLSSKSSSSVMALYGCAVNQILDGKEPNDIIINYVIIDAGNKKELLNLTWPNFDSTIINEVNTSNITSLAELMDTSIVS